MIVRIATEDQYRLPDADADRLNQLDNEAAAAVDADDEARFQDALRRMVELVRAHGMPIAEDELIESDVILPPSDSTLADVGDAFTGEGLIPG